MLVSSICNTMNLRSILISGLMILFASGLSGQSRSGFTADSVVFIEELNAFFEEIRLKDNREEALMRMQTFRELWMAENFDPAAKTQIYAIANLMLDRRLKSYPDFMEFIRALNLFKTREVDGKNFDIWLQTIKQTLEASRNTRNFKALIDFTLGFLGEQSLYQSRIHRWMVTTNRFSFVNDSAFAVAIPETDLVCVTKNDSSVIYHTGGRYFPEQEKWNGTGGKITWERAGLLPENVYARLENYTIPLRDTDFSITPVNFYNNEYLPGPLTGTLREKTSTYTVSPGDPEYPQFFADIKKLFIENIYRDVDYRGGFAMKGAKILGTGDEFNPAEVTFRRPYRDKRGDYDLLIARSDVFVIEPEKMYSSQAAVAIYHQDDSIFHSGLQFKYRNGDREVSMLRIKPGVEQSPYFDTYHDVEIDCEAVYWDMDGEQIDFRSTKGLQSVSDALFISDKFYSERQFDYLQGLDFKHPLLWIKDFSKAYNTREFFIYELARFMNKSETQTEAQVIRLAQQGFLYYDVDRKKARITDKVFHYIDSKNGKTDYDVIHFFSEVDNRDNATLSLDNFDLTIRGVPVVSISDSQNVYIHPSGEEVTLRKNKDFLFSGRVKAGLFEFQAKDCSFEYDTFKLNMPTIENVRFKVRAFEKDENGFAPLVDVKTQISNISGNMLIDHPDNKNGLKDFPQYPIFTSQTESYVYYDQDSTLKEAYNRERFYFYIYPFEMKNLVDFSTDEISFAGSLNSGGILPDSLEESLEVMPDYSLGFYKRTPEKGFPVYRGKGTFTNNLQLSMKGLQGEGTLSYLGSESYSDKFMLYPDSLNAGLQEFRIDPDSGKQTGYPEVRGNNLTQHWLPYSDSMIVSTNDSALTMYNDKVSFDGSLVLTPDALSGNGKLDFFNATAKSDRFTFDYNAFHSDTTDLFLRILDEEDLAFSTQDYRTFVDFENMKGTFETNGSSSRVNFPGVRYVSAMDAFDWYIKENEIDMFSRAGETEALPDTTSLSGLITATPPGSRFISLHPLQDSLSFYAPGAKYNLTTNTLVADGVKIIKVADAAIFPGNEKIEIREGAIMQPILDAIIIADTLNKNHMITQAAVTVKSKLNYEANGTYAFNNAVGDVQFIEFQYVKVDSLGQTVADGEVYPEQEFELNPVILYRGDVHLNAGNPLLDFDGAFLIRQDCDPNLSRWVKFHQPIDPDSMMLPVSKYPREFGQKQLYTGFFHSNEENRIYPAFMSRRSYYSDTLMLSVDGWLATRKRGAEFLIASKEGLGIPEDQDPTGPFMKLNTRECTVSANGAITFGTDLGEMELEAFGRIDHFLVPDSSIFNVFMRIEFFFANEALAYMSEKLRLANVKGLEISEQPTSLALNQILGKEKAEEILTDISLYGSMRDIPEKLNASIILSDVNLTYNPSTRSFISHDPIGVAMIKGETVNKYFEGYLEIVRKRSGDQLNFYIEIDRRHWYFFSYSNNVLQSISSQTDFNVILRDIKASKRQDDESAYRYIISTTQKKNRFLREMRKNSEDRD